MNCFSGEKGMYKSCIGALKCILPSGAIESDKKGKDGVHIKSSEVGKSIDGGTEGKGKRGLYG